VISRPRIRGLLKNVGLVIGRAQVSMSLLWRAEELIADRPELIAVVGALASRARQAHRAADQRSQS